MSDLILLVEDNSNDADLTLRAFKKKDTFQKVLHLEDGEEAIDYLFDEKNLMPKMIILDLKMPKMNGLDVLRRLKQDIKKRLIPIIMFTSSKEERDLTESYGLGVNSYIVKPIDYHEYTRAVNHIESYWMRLNQGTV